MRTIASVALALVGMGIPLGTAAQTRMTGVVSDHRTGAPIADVLVQFPALRLRTASEPDGSFGFGNIQPGTHTLRVTRIGYEPLVMTVVATGADSLHLALTLRTVTLRLRDIVVTPGRFGVMDETVNSQQTLTREEIETIPQVGEDVFRAVRRLPGIASGDISTRLNVRGGTDQELLVRLDGMELYEPYHLKDFDAVFGIVDVQAVGGIDLATGGFSVEQGDKLTGVFDMYSRQPPPVGTRTTLGLSITNLSVMSQGAFAGGNGQWLASARRGYLDIALALTGGGENLSPRYADAFGKVEYQLHPNHRLSVHALHGSDALSLTDTEDEGHLRSGWASSYGWLTWRSQFGNRLVGRTMVFGGHVSRRRGGWAEDVGGIAGLERINLSDQRQFDFAGIKHDLSVELSADVLLKVGGEAKVQTADYDYFHTTRTTLVTTAGAFVARFDTVDVATAPTGREYSAYLAMRFRPVAPLTAEIGARYDRFTHVGESYVTPRVLAAWRLSETTNLRASWGRYQQSHGVHELDVGDGEERFQRSDRAGQVAVGLEQRVGAFNVRVEAYARRMLQQRRRFFNAGRELNAFPEAEEDRIELFPGEGRARGVEFLVERDQGRRWAWAFSYVYAVAEDEMGGVWVRRPFDQPHTLTAHVVYRPGHRWHLSWGFHAHSGWPATDWRYVVDPLIGGAYGITRTLDDLNAEQLPTYHRLDFRVTRTFSLGSGVLQTYLDLFNFYGRNNLRSYGYDVRLTDGNLAVQRVRGEELMPFLPSLGFRYEF